MAEIITNSMLPRYLEYAAEHGICYKSNDPFDLYRQCNIHHYNVISTGQIINTRCFKNNSKCYDNVCRERLLCNSKITIGDNDNMCKCRCTWWNQPTIPESLTEFNLDSKFKDLPGELECDYGY
jgi:hypothetical protein